MKFNFALLVLALNTAQIQAKEGSIRGEVSSETKERDARVPKDALGYDEARAHGDPMMNHDDLDEQSGIRGRTGTRGDPIMDLDELDEDLTSEDVKARGDHMNHDRWFDQSGPVPVQRSGTHGETMKQPILDEQSGNQATIAERGQSNLNLDEIEEEEITLKERNSRGQSNLNLGNLDDQSRPVPVKGSSRTYGETMKQPILDEQSGNPGTIGTYGQSNLNFDEIEEEEITLKQPETPGQSNLNLIGDRPNDRSSRTYGETMKQPILDRGQSNLNLDEIEEEFTLEEAKTPGQFSFNLDDLKDESTPVEGSTTYGKTMKQPMLERGQSNLNLDEIEEEFTLEEAKTPGQFSFNLDDLKDESTPVEDEQSGKYGTMAERGQSNLNLDEIEEEFTLEEAKTPGQFSFNLDDLKDESRPVEGSTTYGETMKQPILDEQSGNHDIIRPVPVEVRAHGKHMKEPIMTEKRPRASHGEEMRNEKLPVEDNEENHA